MRFLCAIRIVCWRVSVFYVAAVSAIPADGVPCGGRVLHGHLLALPLWCPVGGLPSLSPACPATALPCWVARLFWSLANPAFSLFSCPIPPAPLPLRGRGRFFCFLMQGAAPLASPALDRLRHLQSLPLWCLKGGRDGFGRLLSLPLWCLKGGLPSLSPANPAFSLFSCPIPPAPLPLRGRGRFFCFLMQGASPLASPALDRLRHLQILPSR